MTRDSSHLDSKALVPLSLPVRTPYRLQSQTPSLTPDSRLRLSTSARYTNTLALLLYSPPYLSVLPRTPAIIQCALSLFRSLPLSYYLLLSDSLSLFLSALLSRPCSGLRDSPVHVTPSSTLALSIYSLDSVL